MNPINVIEQESNDDPSNDKTINDEQSQNEPILLPDKMFEQTLDILGETRTVNRMGSYSENEPYPVSKSVPAR